MTEPGNAACDAECGQFIRDYFADNDTEVVVSSLPRLVPSPYEDLGMTCPHGVTWHTEPTSDQQARWAREGVR